MARTVSIGNQDFEKMIQSFMTSLCISTGIIIWKYYIC